MKEWLNGAKPAVLDAFNVLSKEQREEFRAAGCIVTSIGRGNGQ